MADSVAWAMRKDCGAFEAGDTVESPKLRTTPSRFTAMRGPIYAMSSTR
jgi:hypothetical protein